MMLGDMLESLDDETKATEMIFGFGNLQLLAGIRQRAEAEGIDLATFAREAMQRYAAQASDEEWITLMGVIGRSDDPAGVCLKRALSAALK